MAGKKNTAFEASPDVTAPNMTLKKGDNGFQGRTRSNTWRTAKTAAECGERAICLRAIGHWCSVQTAE